jgi:hypothetical protein
MDILSDIPRKMDEGVKRKLTLRFLVSCQVLVLYIPELYNSNSTAVLFPSAVQGVSAGEAGSYK